MDYYINHPDFEKIRRDVSEHVAVQNYDRVAEVLVEHIAVEPMSTFELDGQRRIFCLPELLAVQKEMLPRLERLLENDDDRFIAKFRLRLLFGWKIVDDKRVKKLAAAIIARDILDLPAFREYCAEQKEKRKKSDHE